jgi:drug/metabolite transporter (DMT)-like permease
MTERRPRILAWAALFSVYLVWGSTYLAIRVAVETIPPFLMAGVRYLIAGVVLYPFARYHAGRNMDRPSAAHWRAATIIGALMLLGGNGLVSWAEQTVPSGIAALLVATVPIWLVLLDRVMGKARAGWIAIGGLLLGLVGVALLVMPAGPQRVHLAGAVGVLSAAFFWALGSLYSRSAPQPSSSLLSTSMQMLSGGAVLFVVAFAAGDFSRLDLGRVSIESILGVAWLIGPGSIIGMTSYIYVLKKLPTSTVGTYAYVNPIVAVFLGWVILDEVVTLQTLVGGAVILLAVVLTVAAQARRRERFRTEPAEVV